MLETFLGSVNRWECDENDHLNVRFYVHKMYQTLVAGLVDTGLITPAAVPQVMDKIAVQQMRFIAEARIAAPLRGLFAITDVQGESLEVLTELRDARSDQAMAAFCFSLQGIPTAGKTLPVEAKLDELPAYAGYRGLTAAVLPWGGCSPAQLTAAGFVTIGRGVVQAEECDAEGQLLNYQYMGRCSDSMPNLWAELSPESEAKGQGNIGGAVLEFQMRHYQPLKLGERFTVYSGIQSLGSKTMHLVHVLYNLEQAQVAAVCQAVSVSMDLTARKAIEIPAAERVRFSARLLSKPELEAEI